MLKRVKQQAAVIAAINKFTPGVLSLAGLSRSAIYDWGKRNKVLELSGIQTVLEDISEKIGCLYDKSNPPKEECPVIEMSQDVQRLNNMMAMAVSKK